MKRFLVKGYDGSDITTSIKCCFRRSYDTEEQAQAVAREVADCVGDVYGRGYSEIIEDGTTLETFNGNYQSRKGLQDLKNI